MLPLCLEAKRRGGGKPSRLLTMGAQGWPAELAAEYLHDVLARACGFVSAGQHAYLDEITRGGNFEGKFELPPGGLPPAREFEGLDSSEPVRYMLERAERHIREQHASAPNWLGISTNKRASDDIDPKLLLLKMRNVSTTALWLLMRRLTRATAISYAVRGEQHAYHCLTYLDRVLGELVSSSNQWGAQLFIAADPTSEVVDERLARVPLLSPHTNDSALFTACASGSLEVGTHMLNNGAVPVGNQGFAPKRSEQEQDVGHTYCTVAVDVGVRTIRRTTKV